MVTLNYTVTTYKRYSVEEQLCLCKNSSSSSSNTTTTATCLHIDSCVISSYRVFKGSFTIPFFWGHSRTVQLSLSKAMQVGSSPEGTVSNQTLTALTLVSPSLLQGNKLILQSSSLGLMLGGNYCLTICL